MNRYITEPSKRIPVIGAYDVAVVGGGVAGVAAALAAARIGANVCLLEKECALGGLATLGLVTHYLPLCDGMGHQVVGGLGEELLRLSVRDGFAQIPACWQESCNQPGHREKRYEVHFNPTSFMLALEEIVLHEGVTLLYDTRFCDVVKKGNLIEAIVVENKSGRSALMCSTVVDATGDADICVQAGEETASLRTNVRAAWFYSWDGSGSRVELTKFTMPWDPGGLEVRGDDKGYAGDEAEDVTAQIVDTRKLLREKLKLLRHQAGYPVYPLLVPTVATLRMTRRLKGQIELDEAHDRHYFEDAVGMTGDWRKPGPIYFIPLRCLTGVKTDNLITAGRCISTRNQAWDVSRAIPTCVVTGEAAGTAAALASRMAEGCFSKLNVKLVQDQLTAQDVIIDIDMALER